MTDSELKKEARALNISTATYRKGVLYKLISIDKDKIVYQHKNVSFEIRRNS